MEIIKIEIVLSGILSVLVGVVVNFLKQLLRDFKKVEKDVTEVKSTTALIRTEVKGSNDLIHQKIEFLDNRVNRLENLGS
ncbi:MAG: hypothetical protein AAF391_12385 [Bacteroidota bacterium]